eukprot:5348475-Alexandrium_andersonii.AAC.1
MRGRAPHTSRYSAERGTRRCTRAGCDRWAVSTCVIESGMPEKTLVRGKGLDANAHRSKGCRGTGGRHAACAPRPHRLIMC